MSGDADEPSFTDFAEARLPALLRYAYLLCGDRQLAEDVVQTVLARTYAAWPGVKTKGNPEAYVRRAIVNAFVNRWRRRVHEEPVANVPEYAQPAERAQLYEEHAAMWAALGRLPQRQRAVLVLRYYEDLTEAEIAATLRCSLGTVKSQASRGLDKLRDVLGLQDHEEVQPT
jgi:RNA polymerase sigma-70 factor (sigma-E family)